ncbi:hypothetical protein C8R46DRAFT_1314196 [Mycena filopes]|nr:hypothetical protein C8R46DRAFT_1314196 [Mycena filopes]
MHYCPGCLRNFESSQGYSAHFSKTLHEPCREIRRAAESQLDLSDSDDEEFGAGLRGEFPTGQAKFTGDFFGDDYVDDDFGYISDSGNEPLNSSDEDDDLPDPLAQTLVDAARARDEDGWEPERAPAIDVDEEMADLAPVPQQCAAPSREIRTIADDRFHQEPTVERFAEAYVEGRHRTR